MHALKRLSSRVREILHYIRQPLSIYWWWYFAYYWGTTAGRVVRALFAASPIGALCVQLLVIFSFGAPVGNLAVGTRLSLRVLAGVSLVFGASAVGLYGRTRTLFLKRLHGLRQLASMLDDFRSDIVTRDNDAAVTERLTRFISEALTVIDEAVFPSASVEMTFMMERASNHLGIVATYPERKEHDSSFDLQIDGESEGYARLAYATGKTVYLPSVKCDWGVEMILARRPGGLPRRKGRRKNLWKESTRRTDYGSLICAPAMVVKGYEETEDGRRTINFDSYGVLNLEDIRWYMKNAFGPHDLYCACLAAGVLGNAIMASNARWEEVRQHHD